MNTGLQDAMNLGWKLGADLAGWAPDWLLDTYHTERHPVGAAVLALTGRQFRLNTARSRPRRALRWAAHRLVAPLPPVQSWLARTYSGMAITYPQAAGQAGAAVVSVAHPLAGRRLPRGQLVLAGGSTARLYDLFHDGRFVLLESGGSLASADLPAQVKAVRYEQCRGPRLPPAALVRPDGYVAWASDERDPAARGQAARAAVAHWCGPASPATEPGGRRDG
jgi:hypothetical protein